MDGNSDSNLLFPHLSDGSPRQESRRMGRKLVLIVLGVLKIL